MLIHHNVRGRDIYIKERKRGKHPCRLNNVSYVLALSLSLSL
jgi:hypothetical protein